MDKHTERKLLTVSSAVVMILAAAAAAHAQEAAPTRLGEVLVTAQKRTEKIQDVPVSISVVDGSRLENGGSTQLTDYSAYVPGMQVDSNGTPGQTTVSLRGIGPLGSSATVGSYVDDAPIGSSGIYNSTNALSFELMPYDIERIEVLRGPQGTLYGASSIGGLLKYVTIAPALDEFEGKVGIEAVDVAGASSNDFNYGARISFPLAKDSLGMSLSYARRELPAYVDNVQTGDSDVNEGSQEGARVALLWQPSETTSLTLSAMRQEVESDDNAVLFEDINGVAVGDGLSTNVFLDEPYESQYDLYSATLNVKIGDMTLTSVTSYSEADLLVTSDATRAYGELIGAILEIGTIHADVSYPFGQKKLTQEIRLASPASDRFEWLVGVFYTDEDNEVEQTVSLYDPDTGELLDGLNPAAVVQLPNEYQEYAIFTNGTFKFSDTFHLSTGVRYAKNDQKFRQISFGLIVPTADVPGTSDEDVVTYSLSPQWHLSDETMLYARVATGYRAGGPNVFLPGVPPTVDSDSMTNYEVGVKSSLAGGNVLVEAAAFYMDWEDIQLGVAFPNGTSGLANAGSAESQGVEGSLSWLASDNFTIGVNGAYTDAKLTSDTPNGAQDGDRLPRTPEWSGSVFADYVVETGGGQDWQFGGLIRYVGDRISDPSSQPNSVAADSYLTVDLSAGVTINDRWTIRAYARNVTDEDGDISRSLSIGNSSLIGGPQFISVVPVQPRTFGLGVEVAF
jgi:outer membrane receptor protein involved in Fe transport